MVCWSGDCKRLKYSRSIKTFWCAKAEIVQSPTKSFIVYDQSQRHQQQKDKETLFYLLAWLTQIFHFERFYFFLKFAKIVLNFSCFVWKTDMFLVSFLAPEWKEKQKEKHSDREKRKCPVHPTLLGSFIRVLLLPWSLHAKFG